jgi:aryl-alcohol dehydrogenase-like predicted oxidoreductase
LAALGRPGYINLGHAHDLEHDYDLSAMEARAHHVLDTAWAAGIRYFDAARSYGRAEPFLGSWLAKRGIELGAVTTGSKWGYTYTAEWRVSLPEGTSHEVKEHSLPVLKRQVRESRTILGDHLGLYQIHSATLESGVLDNHEVLSELARLRDEGLAIGLSVSGPRQAETIRRATQIYLDGRALFSAVQATWNLLERSATSALMEAHEAGVGVIVKEALANGRLTNRNQDPAFRAQKGLLGREAAAQNCDIDAVALAAVLNQPFVDVVLSGAARAEHLLSNVKALGVSWDDSLDSALASLVEPPAHYWHTRSRLEWN